MDVVERLSFDAAVEYTSQACEHIHRYRFAAQLCGGLRVLDLACGSGYGSGILAENAASVRGVDKDVATIDLAAATVGQTSGVTFEASDAMAYLSQELTDQFDIIVCFEGVEHLHDLPTVVRRLKHHVDLGIQLVVSVPNSKIFEEENPFHVTDFDYEDAATLLDELSSDGLILFQYLTEGSLICGDDVEQVDTQTVHTERAETKYANHFVLTVNVDEERVLAARSGRRLIVEAPVHNRYMHGLEVANKQLHRRNTELARKMMRQGAVAEVKAGSAAPAFVVSLRRRIDELEDLVERQTAELAESLTEIGRRDDMILAQRRELLEVRQQLLAKAPPAPAPRWRVRRSLGDETRMQADPADGMKAALTSRPTMTAGGGITDVRRPRLPPEDNTWDARRLKAEMCIIPWIEQFYPLSGRTVLEYGCGTGAVSCAFAPHVHRHIGIDIDKVGVEAGRRSASERGLENVELIDAPVDRIFDRVRDLDAAIDVFLLYAVLEHMTLAERLELLAIARQSVQSGGIIVVCELPNRLIPLDSHTSQMPFFAQLPDELAIRCFSSSKRRDFVSAMDTATEQGETHALEALARWGRGMSFHEFECVFGDLRKHVVASNYDELLMPVRGVSREELVLARLLAEYRPDLAPTWGQYWQDVILSAKPISSVPHFIRPLALEGARGPGTRVLESGMVEMQSEAVLQLTLPVPTDRLLIGVKAPTQQVALEVNFMASGSTASVRLPIWRSLADTRYATLEAGAVSSEVQIRLGAPGHLAFLGYAA